MLTEGQLKQIFIHTIFCQKTHGINHRLVYFLQMRHEYFSEALAAMLLIFKSNMLQCYKLVILSDEYVCTEENYTLLEIRINKFWFLYHASRLSQKFRVFALGNNGNGLSLNLRFLWKWNIYSVCYLFWILLFLSFWHEGKETL